VQFSKRGVWIITGLILLFYILQATILIDTFGHPIGLCDFDFHMDKVLGTPSEYTRNCYNAGNGDTTTFDSGGFSSYPSLIQTVLAGIGVTTQKELFLAMLILVIVIPVWLLIEKVNPLAGFIWLCMTTIHLEILQATIPQATVVALFVLYLLKFRKNYYVLVIFTLLSLALHREGAYFFLIVFALELVERFFETIKFKFNLLAAPIFPTFTTKSIALLPETILFNIPVWLIWISRKAFLNSIFKTGLLLISIWGTLTFSFRISWIAQLLLAIEVAKEMHAGNVKHEKLVIVILVLYLALELAYFSATNYAFFFK